MAGSFSGIVCREDMNGSGQLAEVGPTTETLRSRMALKARAGFGTRPIDLVGHQRLAKNRTGN